MKTLIVDDSRLARQELIRLLEEEKNVEIIGEAAHAEAAISLIHEQEPDLVLLDIQMPGKDGFQLIEELEYLPHIIFTTAYDEYAIKAFEYNALDYLMKPVQSKNLQRALQKVADKLESSEKNPEKIAEEERRLGLTDQVFVKDGEKCWFVNLGEIRLIEVADNYSRVYFEKETPLINRTLNYLEGRLDPNVFFRANRQQIINLRWIERIEPWFSGSLKIFLKGGEDVEISRRQTVRFKEMLSF